MPDGDGTGKVKFTAKQMMLFLINLFLATVHIENAPSGVFENDLQKNRC
jgi:hypothetical protein